MANTISTNLTGCKEVLNIGLATLTSRLAALSAFALHVSPKPLRPAAVHEVGRCTGVGATQTNRTDWEANGDSTVDAVEITPAQISQSFHLRHLDTQGGATVKSIIEKNVAAFAAKCMDVVLAPLTAANYGAATLTKTAAAFVAADVSTLAGGIDSPNRALVLHGGHLMKLAGSVVAGPNGKLVFPGFTNLAENSRWTAAEANVRGFACAPEALIVLAGLPAEMPSSAPLLQQAVTIPGIELQALYTAWIAPGTRTLWCSFDVVIGAAVGDAAALELLKIA